jgi:transcriptional regulator with XRE-family HTH domain
LLDASSTQNEAHTMAYTTLEDFFGDIVGKARRGQGVSVADLAQTVGLDMAQIGEIESYAFTPNDDGIRNLAQALGLDGEKLIAVAHGWTPSKGNEDFEDASMRVERLILDAGMTVNCYLLTCKTTGKGAVIDPGGQSQQILNAIGQANIEVTHILLTHGHGDHVGALEAVADATGALICGCERDFGLMGGRSQRVNERVDDGWKTTVGELTIELSSYSRI